MSLFPFILFLIISFILFYQDKHILVKAASVKRFLFLFFFLTSLISVRKKKHKRLNTSTKVFKVFFEGVLIIIQDKEIQRLGLCQLLFLDL